ncbi:MAG: hypothetical protein PHP01_01060 [Phycisphaerae bacterium]|nr:hypothetical protein [Phycisphaerae bacterium]
MHLVKWFRKNMTKLMAIFVILIMFAFIMPSLLNQLAKPRSSGPGKAMWYYDKDEKISFNDIRQATNELAVLKSLFIDRFLLGQRDLKFVLTGELLFPEAFPGAEMSDNMKSVVMQNQLKISPSKIDDFFGQSRGRAELFWILLKEEAKKAGCTVSPKQAGDLLRRIIEKMTENKVDPAALVKNLCQARQVTEDNVLAAFADMLAVISYAGIVTDIEDVTEMEMVSTAVKTEEKISTQFVEFNADAFTAQNQEPTEEEIAEQFNKYKNYFAGNGSQDNPCGFGYKQKTRVAIEYAIVKLDDVKKLVAVPTEEEAENFYQQNLEQFIDEIPADENDPNSPMIQRQKNYAEVAAVIKNVLLGRKINANATKLLSELVDSAEAAYSSLDFEKATVEQFREKAGDYSAAAEKIAKQNNVKIYTGKTGLLTADDLQASRTLASLIMQGQSRIPTRLIKIVFACPQLGDEAINLGPYDPAKPRMFVSAGPFYDNMGSIAAMVRVIDTAGAFVPENVEFSYEKNLPRISENQQMSENTYSLSQIVKQDCKRLKAFTTACQKAEEFLKLAHNKSWDKALEKFNADYPAKDVADANTFELQQWVNRGRISLSDIEMTKLSMGNSPIAEKFVQQSSTYGKLIDSFYSLFKNESQTVADVPLVIKSEPLLSCYAVKSLSRTLTPIESYENNRQQLAYGRDYVMAQSMAFEFFMPDNIIKRTKLRPAQESKSPQTGENANGDEL